LLIRKAISNAIFPVVKVCVALFLTRIVLNTIGSDNFNVWKEVLAILSLSWVLQLGLNSYLTRKLPIFFENKNKNEQITIISTIAYFYRFCTVIILIIGMCFVHYYVDETNYKYAYITCIIAYCVLTYFSYQKGVLSAKQSYGLIAKYEISSYLLYAIATAIFCYYFTDYRIVFILSILPIILPQIAMYLVIRNEHYISFKAVSWKLFKEAFSYSYSNVLFTAAIMLLSQVSFVIVLRLLPEYEATAYILTYQLVMIFSSVSVLMLATLKPQYSKMFDNNRLNNVIKLKSRVTILIILLSSIYYGLMYFFLNKIIELWVGTDIYTIGNDFIVLLSLYSTLYILLYSDYIYLSATDQHKKFGWIVFSSSLVGVSLSIIFVKEAITVLYIINCITLVPLLCARKNIKLKLKEIQS
jgi:O-antigen/teichoic acid export membrane protein